MDEKMTIAFIGFDGYSDMWDDCIKLFQRFWRDCPYKVLFINNEKDVSWHGVEVLHAGKDAEWSRKVQLAIDNCNTQYLCLLLEDFLVGSSIDTGVVDRTLKFIRNENIRYFKLVNMSRAVKNRDPIYKGYRFLHIIPKSDEYGVSLQAAIWDKEYLAELLGKDNYNAWVFEFNQVKAAEGQPDEPNPGCVFDDRNILNLKHGVIQSKYLPGTIRYFRKLGLELNVEREVMSYTNFYKMRLISKGKYMVPKNARSCVKKLLEKTGMKFVSTVRDK